MGTKLLRENYTHDLGLYLCPCTLFHEATSVLSPPPRFWNLHWMDSHRKLVLLLIKSYQINSEISEHTSETGVLASRIEQHNPWFYCVLFRYYFSHNICISSNKKETKCIFFLFFMTTNIMLSNKLKQGFPFIIFIQKTLQMQFKIK